MSIQRYDTKENWVDGSICDFGPDSHGRYVLHADHLTDKQSALDAQQAAHVSEIERHANENTDLGMQIYKLKVDRDAAVRDRDAAVEALRSLFDVLEDARDHLQYTGYGDSYERSAARQERLPERIAEALDMGSAALAKIEGGRNGQDV